MWSATWPKEVQGIDIHLESGKSAHLIDSPDAVYR